MNKRTRIEDHDSFIRSMLEITRGMNYDQTIEMISTIMNYGEKVAEETEKIKTQYLQEGEFPSLNELEVEKIAYSEAIKKINPKSIQEIRSQILERDFLEKKDDNYLEYVLRVLAKLGIFGLTKRPEDVIFFRKRMLGFYKRVIIHSWEYGYEIRNGVVYPLQTGVQSILRAPWNDVEILIISGADFPVQVVSNLSTENYHVHVHGTVYGRVIDATSLLQNVHDPPDTVIKNFIITACENSLLKILSTFKTYLQVEQTRKNLNFDIQPQVAYLTTRGLAITDLRITHIELPEEIRRAIHAITASEHTARQIRNIESEIGHISQEYGYGYFDRKQIRSRKGVVRPLDIIDVLSVLMLSQFIGGRPQQIPIITTQPRVADGERTEDG